MKTKILLSVIAILVLLIGSLLVYIYRHPSFNQTSTRERPTEQAPGKPQPLPQGEGETKQETEQRPTQEPAENSNEEKYTQFLKYGIKPYEADFYEQE